MDRTDPYKLKIIEFLGGMTDDLDYAQLQYAADWIIEYVVRPSIKEFGDPSKWDDRAEFH